MKETGNTTLDAMLLFRNVHEAIKKVADRGEPDAALSLYLAIGQYGLYGELPELYGTAAIIWDLIFPILENGRNKALAGKKGGKASKHNNSNGRRGKAANANDGGKPSDNSQKTAPTIEASTLARITPPSVKGICRYVAEYSLNVDAQAFFDYYDKRNWQIDGKPIRMGDIGALLHNWDKRAK